MESGVLAGLTIGAGFAVWALVPATGPYSPFVAAVAVGLVAGGEAGLEYTAETGPDANPLVAAKEEQAGFGDAFQYFMSELGSIF